MDASYIKRLQLCLSLSMPKEKREKESVRISYTQELILTFKLFLVYLLRNKVHKLSFVAKYFDKMSAEYGVSVLPQAFFRVSRDAVMLLVFLIENKTHCCF